MVNHHFLKHLILYSTNKIDHFGWIFPKLVVYLGNVSDYISSLSLGCFINTNPALVLVIIELLKQCKSPRVQPKMICVPLLVCPRLCSCTSVSLSLHLSVSRPCQTVVHFVTLYFSPAAEYHPPPSALICCFVTLCFIRLNIALCAACLSWFKYVTF